MLGGYKIYMYRNGRWRRTPRSVVDKRCGPYWLAYATIHRW